MFFLFLSTLHWGAQKDAAYVAIATSSVRLCYYVPLIAFLALQMQQIWHKTTMSRMNPIPTGRNIRKYLSMVSESTSSRFSLDLIEQKKMKINMTENM